HNDWHNTDYVQDKSWMTLDKANVPVNELEVRLVASNRLGDTATSKTVAVAKSLHT
ncbi:neural cell adhesion molecule l1, partial [Biomphalaria glabrata]